MKYLFVALPAMLLMTVFSVQAQDTTVQRSRLLDKQPTPARVTIALPGNKARPIPPGPFSADWESIKKNYSTPQWFLDGKFGIFIHYGVYTVPAHASEWYPRHMYSNAGVQKWHTEKYGPVDSFGYKDLIPLFTMKQFDAGAWAALFKKAGARYVIPTAEHHDGFAMYESKLTKWNAKEMGPHIDFIGELATAVRKEGLRFGVSNHRMENWDFMYPQLKTATDLFDPAYADFYGPPQMPPQRKNAPGGEEVIEDQRKVPQSPAFLEEWLARCQELVDKYKPDMFWFDNGINSRSLDSIKLRFAAYYYNSAKKWKKDVSISTKSDAYLAGSIRDFERQGRAPKEMTDYVWQTDDPIGEKFGYVEGMKLTNAGTIVKRLVDNISRNGNYMLNISPMSDGTIPVAQQEILLGVGKWLDVNGEAVYESRAWTKDAENNTRFTKKGNLLFAFLTQWTGNEVIINSLGTAAGKVTGVSMLGVATPLVFSQNETGLTVQLPGTKPCDYVWTLKIEGVVTK